MFSKLSVGQRLLGIITVAVMVTLVQAGMGLYELSTENNSLKSVYENNLVPTSDLGKISILMLENRTILNAALNQANVVKTADKKVEFSFNTEHASKAAASIESNIETIGKLWSGYRATYLAPNEKVQGDKFFESRSKLVALALKPAVVALRANNYEEAKKLTEKTNELYLAASNDLVALIQIQLDLASDVYKSGVTNYENIRLLTFGGLIGAVVMLIMLGIAVSRSITKALGAEPDEMNKTASRIAAGDLNFSISLAANDRSSAMAAMVTMQDKIKLLVADAAMLSKAAVEGKLSTRADAAQHQGDFRKVVEGVNATLDAVIGPLNVSANYVERISKGDIPTKITNTYNGDFNTIKNNLNACIDAVNKMATDAAMLSQAAVEGKLSTRADASQHQGDFRKIVEGVNHTLDAVIGPLNVAAGYVDNFAKGTIPAKITESYNGDFNIIKNNLNACVDALSLLVTDANMLAQAAQDNRLDTRADASKHWGDYRKVVEGVNGTLDTVMQKTAADAAEKAQEAQVLSDAVDETQAIIEGAKSGDLTSRVSLVGKTGAIASLCDGVNALMDKMTEVIVQVREAGETINTAAGEISSGNTDLSSRTEQQASSLEETASSMEELASTVKQNAENAKQANQLAAAASGVAVKGGSVVNEVIVTMVDINASSRKIEDIISVIDGIAFQTNILALNAAVEAARAGEQGRGFAVVAGEVRNLAQRSAGAAKEIKQLISDSVSKVQNGTKLVEDAGKTMGEIVSSVQRVTDIMGEITAASVEQSAGIDQVNDAITSMDEVTQQNAALVEQAAAAAESLVDQAVSLIEVVSAFQLNGSTRLLTANAPSRANKSISHSGSSRQPARLTAKPTYSAKPTANPALAKVAAKTGTNDGDWEEF